MRKICFLVMVCFVRSVFSLVWRLITTITQIKKTTLIAIITKIGARNAPISAPNCNMKQLKNNNKLIRS